MAKRLSHLLDHLHAYFPYGFPLNRHNWEALDVTELLKLHPESAKPGGAVIGLRKLADRLNEKRHQSTHRDRPIHGGELASVGTIVDILRYVTWYYTFEQIPGILDRGLEYTRIQRGEAVAELPPPAFVKLYPPQPVMLKREKEERFLSSETENQPNRHYTAIELILLALSMENPAFVPFQDLFDHSDLRVHAPYEPFVEGLEGFFNGQPAVEQIGEPLLKALRGPMRAAPDSLEGQLAFIKEKWADILPDKLLEELLLAQDVLREERTLRGIGPGPIEELRFGRYGYGGLLDYDYPEPANFSRDADWMSNVVLLAKSVYVWLDQLSKKYQCEIKRLDQIPDEELDTLQRWGFTGLWLIGLWERSNASQKIKQIMGNPEAAPSAYSLYDYIIASDLGGEEAYRDLRDRAARRGIRLASDMVPNHTGIFSKWVIEHPHWFVQSDYPPYPNYQFNGPDLSDDERVVIQIEDGYWDRRDAAVVFKRYDKQSGDSRYIYHGNDGTSMPWNDTAQLNYLIPEVREAVVQTILHVARMFSIIRFDAAMTLAKKHYQRLWYPQPGDGGAIPSRAERGMTRQEFDEVFPKEFWREVVDRVKEEVPDTLLLAEAFWLMEGYFVRTLGMHRVYNSAFMNMLKMEENQKYRSTVKNVLKFSPEVLKRFVNFMNNPDERTAVDQFGKSDKYYGVAMMMATMPGLPMFGHGQVEGFTEKYGMEYRKAYWDEQVDEHMVRRHEREIFPLLHRRWLFSGADNFALYDYFTPDGWVNENVYAYTNRVGDHRALVLFNNSFESTRGWARESVEINVGTSDDEQIVRKTLADALSINGAPNHWYRFRDSRTGQEFLREGRQLAEEGMYAELSGYEYHVFLEWQEVYDHDGSWRRLADRLQGAGVPSMEHAFRQMHLDPIHEPFSRVINGPMLHKLAADPKDTREEFRGALYNLLDAATRFVNRETDFTSIEEPLLTHVEKIYPKPKAKKKTTAKKTAVKKVATKKKVAAGEPEAGSSIDHRKRVEHVATAWSLIHHLDHAAEKQTDDDAVAEPVNHGESWLLWQPIRWAFSELLQDEGFGYNDHLLLQVLVENEELVQLNGKKSIHDLLAPLLEDPKVREYLALNTHDDRLWCNKERLERLVAARDKIVTTMPKKAGKKKKDDTTAELGDRVLDAAEKAGYDVNAMLELLET